MCYTFLKSVFLFFFDWHYCFDSRNSKKKFHMMRFNSTLNVDFTKWSQVKMERENNQKEYRGVEEEMPK